MGATVRLVTATAMLRLALFAAIVPSCWTLMLVQTGSAGLGGLNRPRRCSHLGCVYSGGLCGFRRPRRRANLAGRQCSHEYERQKSHGCDQKATT